jgi:hypothetical protein
MGSSSEKDTYHYQVALFLRSEKSEIFELNSYHREILRVVADYCDMPLGFCCVKQHKLAVECGMSRAQIQKAIDCLIVKKLLHRVINGKLNRYRIGQEITGIDNDEIHID